MQNRDTSSPKPQALPESIGNLDNLKQLRCINNTLQRLPELPKTPVSTCESIGNLDNLPEGIRKLINVQFVPLNKRGI
jgi:Leucine-rich repeat (LRR) protein